MEEKNEREIIIRWKKLGNNRRSKEEEESLTIRIDMQSDTGLCELFVCSEQVQPQNNWDISRIIYVFFLLKPQKLKNSASSLQRVKIKKKTIHSESVLS